LINLIFDVFPLGTFQKPEVVEALGIVPIHFLEQLILLNYFSEFFKFFILGIFVPDF